MINSLLTIMITFLLLPLLIILENFSTIILLAIIAQSVERIHGKDEVLGSIPSVGSKEKPLNWFLIFSSR